MHDIYTPQCKEKEEQPWQLISPPSATQLPTHPKQRDKKRKEKKKEKMRLTVSCEQSLAACDISLTVEPLNPLLVSCFSLLTANRSCFSTDLKIDVRLDLNRYGGEALNA